MSNRQLHVLVAARRKERGWTQAELAVRAGLSRTAVSAVETGRVVPSTAASLGLARALDCRVEDLFVPSGSRPGASADGWAWPAHSGERRYWVAEVRGRILRFPVEPLATGSCAHDGTTDGAEANAAADPRRTLVVAGCDPAAGILGERLSRTSGNRLLPFPRSSRRSLALLREGRVHAAGLHLSHDLEGNASIAKSELGSGIRLLHVARWTEGIALAPGLGIDSVGAAVAAGLRWVSREEGSGARQCLDDVLEGRFPEGHDHAATDHRGVVETIRTGWAQAGPCVRLAAEEAGLEFLPVRRESYDLCFPADLEDDPRVEALIDAVRTVSFRRLVAALPGYDARETGART